MWLTLSGAAAVQGRCKTQAWCWQRSAAGCSTGFTHRSCCLQGEVERRIVSQLLTLMDGLKSRSHVIVSGVSPTAQMAWVGSLPAGLPVCLNPGCWPACCLPHMSGHGLLTGLPACSPVHDR